MSLNATTNMAYASTNNATTITNSDYISTTSVPWATGGWTNIMD